MRRISQLILRVFGWKTIYNAPADLKKFVVAVAPHTSNWDFVMGWLGYASFGLKAKFLIKKESFFFPLGILLKKLGAIPVDRSRSSNIVRQVVRIFNESDNLIVTITPEGTRKLVKRWKKGFYYIAHEANVPIALAALDYKNKVVGIGKVFYPTGNYEEDLKDIEAFYRGRSHGRHPENFNLT